jgi:hypothetical protein
MSRTGRRDSCRPRSRTRRTCGALRTVGASPGRPRQARGYHSSAPGVQVQVAAALTRPKERRVDPPGVGVERRGDTSLDRHAPDGARLLPALLHSAVRVDPPNVNAQTSRTPFQSGAVEFVCEDYGGEGAGRRCRNGRQSPARHGLVIRVSARADSGYATRQPRTGVYMGREGR